MFAARTAGVALAVASLVVGQAARAGLLDDPPPRFGDVDGQIVFRMGPIHYQPGRTDTVITCTNVDDVAATVAVEVFDESDHVVGLSQNTPVSTSGGSVTFVTSADASRANWVVIEGLAPLDHGKARVSATTAKLSCSAHHQIRDANGGVREQPLELIKKLPAR